MAAVFLKDKIKKLLWTMRLRETLPASAINKIEIKENNEPLVDIKEDAALFLSESLQAQPNVYLRQSVYARLKKAQNASAGELLPENLFRLPLNERAGVPLGAKARAKPPGTSEYVRARAGAPNQKSGCRPANRIWRTPDRRRRRRNPLPLGRYGIRYGHQLQCPFAGNQNLQQKNSADPAQKPRNFENVHGKSRFHKLPQRMVALLLRRSHVGSLQQKENMFLRPAGKGEMT